MARNKKRILVPNIMGAAGWDVLEQREDVEPIAFATTISAGDFLALLKSDGDVNGVILGLTRFGEAQCAAAGGLQLVARIGVGYDTIDVSALTRRHVPLMV